MAAKRQRQGSGIQCCRVLTGGDVQGQRNRTLRIPASDAEHAALSGQIPGPRETGKTDALAFGSTSPGKYTEINERQSPANGTLP